MSPATGRRETAFRSSSLPEEHPVRPMTHPLRQFIRAAKRIADSAAPLLSRGGVAARQGKSCEATLARADGVVLIKKIILLTSTTPAAAFIKASPYRARASRASASP